MNRCTHTHRGYSKDTIKISSLVLQWNAAEHITNKDIQRRFREEQEILSTVKSRKMYYFGNIMRNQHKTPQLIIEVKLKEDMDQKNAYGNSDLQSIFLTNQVHSFLGIRLYTNLATKTWHNYNKQSERLLKYEKTVWSLTSPGYI